MKDRNALIFWFIGVLLAISLIVFTFSKTVWTLTFYNVVSVINLDDEELDFASGNSAKDLSLYDSTYIRSSGDVDFQIKSSDSDFTKVLAYQGNTSRLFLYVNSTVNRYCYFSADVTAVYYNTTDGRYLPEDMAVLTTQPSNYYEATMDWNKNEYIFPGRYNTADLPIELSNRKLIGFYPVDCKDINNTEMLKDLVTFYKDFDPVLERKFLEAELNKLQS